MFYFKEHIQIANFHENTENDRITLREIDLPQCVQLHQLYAQYPHILVLFMQSKIKHVLLM